MLDNKLFTLPNIMDKAIQSSWKKQEILMDNVANIDTPGYRRRDINFEKVLTEEVEKTKNIHNIDINKLYGEIISPYSGFEHRIDGSNVDVDYEMSEVAKNKIKYDALVTQTSRHLQRIKSAITNVR